MNKFVLPLPYTKEFTLSYEGQRNRSLAKIIAKIKGYQYQETFSQEQLPRESQIYFVPDKPIVGFAYARKLKITTENDLFGGVVAEDFIKTKVIMHRLVSKESSHPQKWNYNFSQEVARVVLPGFSAFTIEDIFIGVEKLLKTYAKVRLKLPLSSGSKGQYKVQKVEEIDSLLSYFSEKSIEDVGIVVEANLNESTTYSIGTVFLDGITISYYGTQHTTRNNKGEQAYGGSNLVMLKGSLNDLLRLSIPSEVRLAIEQAIKVHNARKLYKVISSRSNYDVIQGKDEKGNFHSGVLEQSWRVGGASGAEVIAIQAFKENPKLLLVEGSTHDEYGENIELPAGAVVHYRGIDSVEGMVTQYTHLTRKREISQVHIWRE